MKKRISILVICAMLFSNTAFALDLPNLWSPKTDNSASGLYFSEETSKKLVIDFEIQKEGLITCGKELSLCDRDRRELDSTTNALIQRTDGLIKDYTEVESERVKFKEAYIKADKDRLKCIDSKPSRLNWFAGGAVTSLLVVTIAALLAR